MSQQAENGRVEFVHIRWDERDIALEYQWIGDEKATGPVVVFLHEGLGSLAMWRNFPQRFCEAAGVRGLVFSRYGYGRSTPRPADEKWAVDFMHRQADEVLPLLFAALGVVRPWLFGHSDGASIALLHAARYPASVAGIIVVAPHLFGEDLTIASIREARVNYLQQDDAQGLHSKLARYHADPDSAFWGWNDIWLSAAFREWNIEREIAAITCPVLAVQGEDDAYGTLEQIYGVRRQVPAAELLALPQCGHSVHRDQPQILIGHAARFINQTAPQKPYNHNNQGEQHARQNQ
jgi:pimeloyl-ACP methyl ester carboxylesterase